MLKPSSASLTDRTVAGLLWMAWGKVAHTTLQVVVLAVLARLLAPADFGVVSAALIVIGFSAIISHLGLGPALVQRPELHRRHVDTAFVVSFSLGIALGVLLWAAAPLLSEALRIPRSEPVLKALAWIFPFQGLGTVAESLIKRELQFRRLANLEVLSYAVGSGFVGIGLALWGWGVWALVAAHIAQVVVKTGALLRCHPPALVPSPDRAALGDLLYFGGGFTVARLANFLALQGDNLVVARTLGPIALGFYGRAYHLMAAPAHGFGAIVDAVLFPAMAQVQLDKTRLALAYRRGVTLISLLVAPASIMLILVAPEIIHILLGPRWTPVILPFQILAIGMLFRTSYKISDSLARSTGAVYRRAWRQVLYAVLVVGGAWIGHRWGLGGVALGVLLAVAVNFFLMADLSLRVTGMTWRDFLEAHLPAAALSAVLAPLVAITVAASRSWNLPPVAVALAAFTVFAAGAAAGIRMLPAAFLGRDGLWMLSTLRAFAASRIRPARTVASGTSVTRAARESA